MKRVSLLLLFFAVISLAANAAFVDYFFRAGDVPTAPFGSEYNALREGDFGTSFTPNNLTRDNGETCSVKYTFSNTWWSFNQSSGYGHDVLSNPSQWHLVVRFKMKTDKTITNDDCINIRLNNQPVFKISDNALNDGNWHTVVFDLSSLSEDLITAMKSYHASKITLFQFHVDDSWGHTIGAGYLAFDYVYMTNDAGYSDEGEASQCACSSCFTITIH